jgi:hypothetical protein
VFPTRRGPREAGAERFGPGLFVAVVPAALVCLASAPAFADASGDGSGYGTQPGFEVAMSHSGGCAGHGAFGAFGKDHNMAGGANGQATGAANSSLCGNPQGH